MKTNRILAYLVVGLLGFAGSARAVSMRNSPPEVYINTPLIFTLTQGDSTYAIPVLEKAQDVVAFYNYYSASSHTGYEVAYESKVFLYRNTIDNSLHLVITHNIDSPPPTGSGRVDFDLSGIPARAYVSQSDDPSHAWDPPRTQEFSLAYPAMEGHWYYIDNTDGGVLSGLPLDTAWCITIEPLYFNNINRWIYHFGSGDPIELDMNEDVTLCFTPPEDPEAVNIDEGGQVSFSGFFDDPDAFDTHTALWEFGDSNDSAGTFSPGVGYTHHDMDPIVYTYGDNGTFDASLTVTDNHGGAGSADISVIAANLPPTVEAGSDLTIVQGDPLIISASFSDPGWSDTHRATINWGDWNTDWGTVVEENDPPDATGTVTGSHVYGDCDIFMVSVMVIDDDWGTGADSLYVTVVDATPPEITCPLDTVMEADENCEVVYSGPTATATDNCDSDPTITSEPPLPATFGSVGDHVIVFTATDFSGNASVCTMAVTVLPTSSCLKTEAIPFLEALKPTGHNHLDKEIDKVIHHIEKSLEPDLWTDVKHLGCKHGHKVFNEEKTAIVKLVKEMNKHKFPPELVDDFEIVINMLLDADEILARTQLDDAIDYGGEEKHIEKAESEMVNAQEKRDEGDHIHAIDHYRKAWDFACKAMGNPPEGGVQVALMRVVPSRFALSQNSPNPFSRSTSIRYQVPVPAHVVLKVYDLSGRAIRTLVDGGQESGCYAAEWKGRDEEGKKAAAGIYFARFGARGFTSTRKMVLLR